MRAIPHFLAFGAAAVIAITAIVGSATLAAEGRSGHEDGVQFLKGTKVCSTATGRPVCVMTTTTAFLEGASVTYIGVPPAADVGTAFARIDSDVVLETAVVTGTKQSTATGHCTFYFGTGTGLCTYSRGTRDLAGFHAEFMIGLPPGGAVYSVIGKYWFSGGDDRD